MLNDDLTLGEISFTAIGFILFNPSGLFKVRCARKQPWGARLYFGYRRQLFRRSGIKRGSC